MKIKIILSALIVTVSGLGLAFAGTPAAMAVKQVPPQAAADKSGEFKDILVKLVHQDEFLDEVIESLGAKKNPTAHDLSALGLNLKLIAGNLNSISALNRTEFAEITPGSELSNYTNAILSYSRKLDRKTAQVSAITARLASANKKGAMRDAVSSKKGRKGGKRIAQMAAEQSALADLAADARTLRGASRGLNATSKWLYIASK